jgi:hypothetical protein
VQIAEYKMQIYVALLIVFPAKAGIQDFRKFSSFAKATSGPRLSPGWRLDLSGILPKVPASKLAAKG